MSPNTALQLRSGLPPALLGLTCPDAERPASHRASFGLEQSVFPEIHWQPCLPGQQLGNQSVAHHGPPQRAPQSPWAQQAV